MKSIIKQIERWFEKLVDTAVKVYGHSITLILAVILVIFFLADKNFYRQNIHDIIRDMMFAVTFLSFFIIQKAVNKYSMAVHIKMNELVSAHAAASNEMVNIENKTEEELNKLAEKQKHLEKTTNQLDKNEERHE